MSPNNDVSVSGQKINDLALAFVAPLPTNYCYRGHGKPFNVRLNGGAS